MMPKFKQKHLRLRITQITV